MPGERIFKALMRLKKRRGFYLSKARIDRLGWKTGEKLEITLGPYGEAYITKTDSDRVTLSRMSEKQYRLTMPGYKFLSKLNRVRITETNTSLILNFFD